MATKRKLRVALDATAFKLAQQGETHIKKYEIAFQEVIENLFPKKPWYEVTSCNIFMKLMETRNITETIECIVDGLREDTITEMLKENDAITFTLPPEAMNDPASVDFKAVMAKQRADHEARKAEEAEQKRREELRNKYADLLSKVAEAEDKHEALFDALVPSSGACDTVAGELIRAITKIMYRDYNDGDLFYEGYGIETAGNAASYLSDHGFEDDIIHIAEMGLEDDAYTKALEKLDAKIIQSIIDNPELLETPLDYDMYEADSEWLKDYQPRYEYSYGVSEKIEAYLEAGLITSWDCVQVVEEWLQYNSAFEGAEVSRPWGYADREYTIENLTKEGLEECQNWERWNMWEDYENDLYEEYGDPTEEDEDEEYDESIKRPVKESTWAEREMSFTKVTLNKLEKIHSVGLWDEFEDAVDDNSTTCNVITGVFTDMYRTARPEYSSCSEEDIKLARKELFRIINDFYKKALAADEETLTEDTDDFNPIAWMKEIPKWSLGDINFVQKLLGPAAIAETSENYLEIKAATNDYIQSGIINVSDKFIEEFTAYVEKTYPDWTIRHNNTANIYWLTNKR